jgi:hypothetical protein
MSAVAAAVIAAVAAVAATAATTATTLSASADAERSERESMGLARLSRSDALRRQSAAEGMSYQQLQLERQSLGLSAVQANRNYRMAKQQWADQKAAGERQEKRTAAQTGLSNIMGYINSNDALKNQVVNRFGA